MVSHHLHQGYGGLEEIADAIWNGDFGPLKLGRLHEAHARQGRI